MNVSISLTGRHVRSDLTWRKLMNHKTETTLEPKHSEFSFSSHVIFPSQQAFLCEQMGKKLKNLERMNVPKRKKAGTVNQARAVCRAPGIPELEEEGLWEKVL